MEPATCLAANDNLANRWAVSLGVSQQAAGVSSGSPLLTVDGSILAEALLEALANSKLCDDALSAVPSGDMPAVVDLPPPPGLSPVGLSVPPLPSGPLQALTLPSYAEASAPMRPKNFHCTPSVVQEQAGLAITLGSDGIARLVPPGLATSPLETCGLHKPHSAQHSQRSISVEGLGKQAARFRQSRPTRPQRDVTAESLSMGTSSDSSSCGPAGGSLITHTGADNVTLKERVHAALSSGESVVIDVTADCVETEPLEISHGEVLLRGPAIEGGSCHNGAAQVRLQLPGVRVTGGSLCVHRLAMYATEENRVQAGQLRCTDCFITSRNGCGVLCLHRARVFLTGCKVAHCMRSGIGVNGKNTEIELNRCTIAQNNFSGIGINHQARSIILRENRIVDNGYHGIWLNTGVVAQWLGGEISGNKMTSKDGQGKLHGYD